MSSEKTQIVPKGGASKEPYLRLYSNGEFIRSYRLSMGNTVVGRDPSAAIMVNDRFVSRHHFFIEYDEKKNIYFQDLKSRNGSFLNGQKVEREKIKHGDKISFGIFEMVLAYPASQEKSVNAASRPTEPILLEDDETVPPITRPEKKLENRNPLGFRPVAKLPPTREAELEALPYRVIPKRGLHWSIKILINGSVMFVAAAFLAWNAYQWTKLRQQRVALEQQKEVFEKSKLNEIAPKTLPKTVNIKPSVQGDVSAPTKSSDSQNSHRMSNQSRKNMLAGLDRSIGGLLTDDGRDVGKNLKVDQKTGKVGKEFSPVKSESLSVEIKMPAMDNPKDAKKSEAFDLAGYQTMLKQRVGVVQDCYVEHMKDNPLPGQVSVLLSIKSNGSIKRSKIESSSFSHKGLGSCITNELANIKVDAPPWDGFTVTYTFKFSGSKLDLR